MLEEEFGPDRRAMVELAAQVGRRTGELCGLRLECLEHEDVVDEAGQMRRAPVLVYDMPKVGVVGYRLPIDDGTAEIIRAQQARIAARYPGTERSALALFPAPVMNPRGTKGMNVSTFDLHFRTWLDALPELEGEDGEPYDRSKITIYSLRHSFAQRHSAHRKGRSSGRHRAVFGGRQRLSVLLAVSGQVLNGRRHGATRRPESCSG